MPIYNEIVLLAWGVFILVWAVTAFNVKRDASRMGMWRLWVFRVGIIIVAIFLIADFQLGNNLFARSPSLFTTASSPVAALGALLTVLGIALAIWARIYLGRNWSPAPRIKEGHELVTTGPYAVLRHPIYTGVLFAIFGSVLISPAWVLSFVIALVIFLWRVKREETLMMSQFPTEYPAYKARTWALIPYVY
jgi:protein-S-isoprenylcysteine O-methyltransferase Ste14